MVLYHTIIQKEDVSDEMKSSRRHRKREHIILVRILDTMLEGAVLYDTVPDKKNTPGIENVSYFDYGCSVSGKEYSVRITVKKTFNDDVRFFYYYKLLEKSTTSP